MVDSAAAAVVGHEVAADEAANPPCERKGVLPLSSELVSKNSNHRRPVRSVT